MNQSSPEPASEKSLGDILKYALEEEFGMTLSDSPDTNISLEACAQAVNSHIRETEVKPLREAAEKLAVALRLIDYSYEKAQINSTLKAINEALAAYQTIKEVSNG